MLDESFTRDSENVDNEEYPPSTPSPPRRTKKISGNKTVVVEGNIGAGKSTFLNHFQRFKQVTILPEPVIKWRNFHGHNGLDMLYTDASRWSFAFESMVALSMLENHILYTGPTKLKMMERSIHSTRFCFVENFKENGFLAGIDHSILKEYHNWLGINEDLDVDLIVYLRASPEVCHQRIKKRNRSEESTVPLEYLNALHRLHDDWLLHEKFGTLNSNLLVLNANKDLSELQLEIENIGQDILSSFNFN